MQVILMLVTVLHVMVSVILILVVLLQQGGKADLGVFGGGSSQTAFGGAGPTTLLHKITVGAAALFMLTCLVLAINTGKHSSGESPVTKKLPKAEASKPPATTPTPPAQTAPAPGPQAPPAPTETIPFTVGPGTSPSESGAPKQLATPPLEKPSPPKGEAKPAPQKPQ